MKERKIQVAPSILSADFRCLEKEVKAAEDSGADLIHCDIMDGHFVPNITFGPMVCEFVKKSVSIPLDVHLMISNPRDYISAFRNAGADTITVHAEIFDDLKPVLTQIKECGARVGVTVNPDKPAEIFLPHLEMIDQVLIMTVYAGFGGQNFMADMLGKIQTVYDAAIELGKVIDIEVDGGVNHDTARDCAAHGANLFVAGSYVFGQNDYAERIRLVRDGATEGAASLG